MQRWGRYEEGGEWSPGGEAVLCAAGSQLSELISLALAAAAFGMLLHPSVLWSSSRSVLVLLHSQFPFSLSQEGWGHSGPGWLYLGKAHSWLRNMRKQRLSQSCGV